MPLLAMLLVRLFDRSRSPRMGRLFGWALLVVHVVFAALFQVVMNTAIASQEPLYAILLEVFRMTRISKTRSF